MKYIILISSVFILFSCISESELQPIFPVYILNGNSAKAWVETHGEGKGRNDVSEIKAYRNCFIFYSNNSFREQELIHLGSEVGAIGTYSIQIDSFGNDILVLNYHKDNASERMFYIHDIENLTLTLKSTLNSETTLVYKSLAPPLP